MGVLAHIPHAIPPIRTECRVEPSPAGPEAGTGHGRGVVELEVEGAVRHDQQGRREGKPTVNHQATSDALLGEGSPRSGMLENQRTFAGTVSSNLTHAVPTQQLMILAEIACRPSWGQIWGHRRHHPAGLHEVDSEDGVNENASGRGGGPHGRRKV